MQNCFESVTYKCVHCRLRNCHFHPVDRSTKQQHPLHLTPLFHFRSLTLIWDPGKLPFPYQHLAFPSFLQALFTLLLCTTGWFLHLLPTLTRALATPFCQYPPSNTSAWNPHPAQATVSPDPTAPASAMELVPAMSGSAA